MTLFRSDYILSTLTASQRQVAGTYLASQRQVGEKGIILVVRMRRNHQHARRMLQAIEGKLALRRTRKRPLRQRKQRKCKS